MPNNKELEDILDDYFNSRLIHEDDQRSLAAGVMDMAMAKGRLIDLLTAEYQRGARETLQWVLAQDGNCFVGNGENMIKWDARNRLNELEKEN